MHASPVEATCGRAAQLLPQAPQLETSVLRVAHVPAQRVVPAGQAHVPPSQPAPPVQAVHEEPQWLGSVSAFTHVLPQRVCAVGQAQTPD